MAMPKKGLRKLVIDEQVYFLSLSGSRMNAAGDVPISFVVHLEGNDRAKLVVKGITSRDFWHDYPGSDKFLKGVVTITPKAAVTVIKHCITEGWDPTGTGQTNVELDNQQLAAILDAAPDR